MAAKLDGKSREGEHVAAKTTKPDLTKKIRKKLPSVEYLLKHGDPDTSHLPKTWCEIVGYPLVLAMLFAVSLLIFHHAPKSPTKMVDNQSIKRLSIFQRKKSYPPHLMQNVENKDSEQQETEL